MLLFVIAVRSPVHCVTLSFFSLERLPNSGLQRTDLAVSLKGIDVNEDHKTRNSIPLAARPADERVAVGQAADANRTAATRSRRTCSASLLERGTLA